MHPGYSKLKTWATRASILLWASSHTGCIGSPCTRNSDCSREERCIDAYCVGIAGAHGDAGLPDRAVDADASVGTATGALSGAAPMRAAGAAQERDVDAGAASRVDGERFDSDAGLGLAAEMARALDAGMETAADTHSPQGASAPEPNLDLDAGTLPADPG